MRWKINDKAYIKRLKIIDFVSASDSIRIIFVENILTALFFFNFYFQNALKTFKAYYNERNLKFSIKIDYEKLN